MKHTLNDMNNVDEHRTPSCSSYWYCGGELCWDNDFNLSDVYGEGEGKGIVTFLHCMNCGADVEYALRIDQEENS